MNKLSIRDLDLSGNRVFIRVDYNVPLEAGKVTDDTRVRETLPTLRLAVGGTGPDLECWSFMSSRMLGSFSRSKLIFFRETSLYSFAHIFQ